MQPHIKKLWVEALRSGRFKQGRYHLRPTADAFCCLGVLCYMEDEELPRWEEPPIGFVDDYCRMPVMINAGLDRSEICNLIFRNDTGYSFDDIATYIEENL